MVLIFIWPSNVVIEWIQPTRNNDVISMSIDTYPAIYHFLGELLSGRLMILELPRHAILGTFWLFQITAADNLEKYANTARWHTEINSMHK